MLPARYSQGLRQPGCPGLEPCPAQAGCVGDSLPHADLVLTRHRKRARLTDQEWAGLGAFLAAR